MKKIIFLIFIVFSNKAFSFETSAKQAILIDVLSGDVLYEKNIDQKISPASITKIMTAIVAFDLIKKGELSLNEKFKISKNAWRMSSEGYSSMFIMPNDKVSVENLLKGIIIVSGNDACVALAEGIAGTEEEFVNMMNQMAEKIGLKNTRFANSSGLYDGNNYSTVEDISKMSVYLINNFPEFYKYYSEKKFTWDRTGGAPITQGNRNPVLYKNIGGDGIKTGYLDNSGYSLAASIKENERRLLSVISGTNSKNERSRESVRILSYGKNRYDLIKIPKISENYKFKTWNIKQKIINAEMQDNIYLTVPSRKKNKIRIEIENFKNPISKNVKKGENLATINVYFEDTLIKSSKLLSTINTNKESFFVRFLNSFSHFVWG